MQNLRQFIFDKLEEKLRKCSQKIAIESMDGSLTYQEVSQIVKIRANYFLQELGNGNLPVGIRLKDKKEVLLTMLALIKAGKTILPLPYEIPEDKVSVIVANICPQAIISEQELAMNHIHNCTFIALEKLQQLKDIQAHHIEVDYHNENIFCILMTSGTTGIPKGCQLSDYAFLGRIADLAEYFPMAVGDKFLFSGNYSFDVTFTQMFCWLFGEGSIVIQSANDKFNKIPQYVEQFNITHIAISPSILRHIYENIHKDDTSLKYVFVAGEKFPVEIAEKYVAGKAAFELLNLYGPTEFSIYATKYDVSDYKREKSVSIGTPLKEVEVILIDEKGTVIKEANTEGEIVLLGKGIFNGYLNNSQANKQNLIKVNGKLAYKTGDLGYYSDGKYYLIGRRDHQFKINGVRVEAEEIEKKILQYNPLIKEAVVNYENYNGKNILVAYISWKNKKEKISENQITQNIEGVLEKYFLPKYIVSLDELPLNKNGKIDRVALRKIFIENVANELTNDTLNATENIFDTLKSIWESVLRLPLKDEDADFFLSGGDSLDSVVMIMEIEEKLGLALTEEEFITHSSFKQLLSFIVNKDRCEIEKRKVQSSDITWEYLGEEIIFEEGEKILFGSGDEKLYELINASLAIENQVDKIILTESDSKVASQIVREFPLFSRQEFYLRKEFDSILQSTLTFDMPHYAKLIDALNKFVQNQQLARSLIINHRFVEFSYEPLGPKNLDFIDLTFLQHEKANQLLTESVENIHTNLLKNSPNKQLIRFLIVRETFQRAKLYLFVSHHIADAASINVFKNQILSYYQKNEVCHDIPSYESFVNTVISTNDENQLLALAHSAYYKDIKLANDNFRDFFKFDTSIRFDDYEVELKTKDRTERANQLFSTLANIIHKQTGASSFAFQILKNLRYFGNVDYKDIFADIHCSIYTSYHVNNENDKQLFSKSEQDFRNIYEQKGIHIDYLTSSDRFYNNFLISSFEETFLNINYIGEVRKEEVASLLEKLKQASEQLGKLHSNKLRFTCFASGEKGYIVSLGGFSFKE